MSRMTDSVPSLIESYFTTRLPPMLVRRIPQTIINGYADAVQCGPSHIWNRRRAIDRHWAVQAHWATLGNDVPGIKVIEAVASNGGGPYFALEHNGMLLTIYKADDEATAPRWAFYRSVSARRNAQIQLMFESMRELDSQPGKLDVISGQRLADIRQSIARQFDLYAMVTHCPDADGDKPAFINAIVVNETNDVVAAIDVVDLVRRLGHKDAPEVEAVPIAEPQQRRRRSDRKVAGQ